MPYSIFFTNERKKVCSDLVKLIKDKKSKKQSIRSIADCLNVSYEPLLTACSALWFGEVSRTIVPGLWLLSMEILTHLIDKMLPSLFLGQCPIILRYFYIFLHHTTSRNVTVMF